MTLDFPEQIARMGHAWAYPHRQRMRGDSLQTSPRGPQVSVESRQTGADLSCEKKSPPANAENTPLPHRKEISMAGKRQPTALVEANGRKHMSRAEADARRDAEVYVPVPDRAIPPKWLPKKHHAEYQQLGDLLIACGLFSDLDNDVLGQYFIARDSWLLAQRRAAAAIRAKDEDAAKIWTTVQASYFKQARQAGDAMGLTVTSRCRIVVPSALISAGAAVDDSDDAFIRRLQLRQAAMMEAV